MKASQPNPTVAWRMPEQVRNTVVEMAERESRSLGNMLRVLVSEALAARNSKQSQTTAPSKSSKVLKGALDDIDTADIDALQRAGVIKQLADSCYAAANICTVGE